VSDWTDIFEHRTQPYQQGIELRQTIWTDA